MERWKGRSDSRKVNREDARMKDREERWTNGWKEGLTDKIKKAKIWASRLRFWLTGRLQAWALEL